jgi:glutamate-ammonia-ligase adenylyltransferase
MDIARTFAREKNFRVGVRILSETLSAEEAGLGFSTVADVVLTRLLAAVENEMAAKHGALKGGRCAVLGLGKLGGREMTAASDLDIMVIYDHDPKAEQSNGIRALAPTQYYMRLTQMLVAALSAPTGEGILYQVDMRLRPSGSKGPLAVSVASFESYHKAEAWTWERMAMTRARSIAGDQVLARRVEAILVNVFAAPRDPAKTRSDIADMRALMLRENPPDNLWDLKRAPGGQTEIEFIAQYFELIASSRHQGLLNPNTAHVLTAARAAKLLKPRDAEILETALGLYQRLTHVLRLCIDGRFEAQTAPPRLLETLCQAAGQPDLSATEALLAENQETVAAIFETLIGRP